MSVASKKRRCRKRRVERGIFTRHELLSAAEHALPLEMIAAEMRTHEDRMRAALLAPTTPEERFADALVRGWPVYAHPETARAARAAGLHALDHPYIERGQLLAVKPYEPPLFSPIPRSFR